MRVKGDGVPVATYADTETLFGLPTRVREGEIVKSTVPVVEEGQVIVMVLVVLLVVIVVEEEDGVPSVDHVMV